MKRLVAVLLSVVTLFGLIGFSSQAASADAELDTYLAGQFLTDEKTDVLRLYQAFFDREPDVAGANYWMGQVEQGKSLDDIATWFSQGAEFKSVYLRVSNTAFVDKVYQNVLDRPEDVSGSSYWFGLLNSGQLSKAGVVRWIAANDEFRNRFPYDYTFDYSLVTLAQFLPAPDEWGGGWSNDVPQPIVEDPSSYFLGGCNGVGSQSVNVPEHLSSFYSGGSGYHSSDAYLFATEALAQQYFSLVANGWECYQSTTSFEYISLAGADGFVYTRPYPPGGEDKNAMFRVGRAVFRVGSLNRDDLSSFDTSALLNGPDSIYQEIVSQGKLDVLANS